MSGREEFIEKLEECRKIPESKIREGELIH